MPLRDANGGARVARWGKAVAARRSGAGGGPARSAEGKSRLAGRGGRA